MLFPFLKRVYFLKFKDYVYVLIYIYIISNWLSIVGFLAEALSAPIKSAIFLHFFNEYSYALPVFKDEK